MELKTRVKPEGERECVRGLKNSPVIVVIINGDAVRMSYHIPMTVSTPVRYLASSSALPRHAFVKRSQLRQIRSNTDTSLESSLTTSGEEGASGMVVLAVHKTRSKGWRLAHHVVPRLATEVVIVIVMILGQLITRQGGPRDLHWNTFCSFGAADMDMMDGLANGLDGSLGGRIKASPWPKQLSRMTRLMSDLLPNTNILLFFS